jgi:hypothetical protein
MLNHCPDTSGHQKAQSSDLAERSIWRLIWPQVLIITAARYESPTFVRWSGDRFRCRIYADDTVGTVTD